MLLTQRIRDANKKEKKKTLTMFAFLHSIKLIEYCIYNSPIFLSVSLKRPPLLAGNGEHAGKLVLRHLYRTKGRLKYQILLLTEEQQMRLLCWECSVGKCPQVDLFCVQNETFYLFTYLFS